MPINRYEIRDEYSLADPELYRAADKDDPEALLEGVAMAGLVGVLRQLGDLAEFAAEIFHDLHEEVMVTAARGHTLMIRVQQLEADIPSLEKEFLSQTDHSPFFYNSGVDWHSNQQVDQNLVTQRDLPRFVMDSYEECRGPPRLFLLDKFDVAGSGACLKRYTDPSFFKAEASVTANADVLKEKKIRKAKKKGPQGKYGETPEFKRASSHAKLHQLLLEEPVENGVGKPTYRAKLKRRPNGYPFDTKSGKSYMEGLLKSPSPEHKMIHEIIVRSPLEMSTDDHNGSALELRSMSPDRESEGRRSNPPYADIEETVSNPSMNQISYDSSHIKTYGVPSHLNSLTDGAVPIYDEETDEKDITIDGESKLEDSLISYQSDEFASEIDNYVDAPSTMESEIDTDSELRVKKNFTVYTNKQPLASVKNKERCHSMSLDSQSTGDFSISDEGNHSYKKEMSSFSSSNSARTSAENPQSEKLSADGFSYTDSPEFVLVRTPEHFRTDKFSKDLLSNHTYPGKSSAADTRPNIEHPATGLGSTSLPYCNLRRGGLGGAKSDETFEDVDDDEKKRDMILDSPCSPIVSQSKSLGEDSKISSIEEHILDAEIQYASTGADNIDHSSDHVDTISAHMMHEEVYDQKELNQSKNMASIMNMDNVISQNTSDIEETKENPTPSILDGEAAKLTDNFVTDHTDIAGNGDNGIPKVSEEENQSNYLYTEYPEVVSDSEHHFSNCSNVNQISADTSVFSGPEHSPILLEAGLDTQDTDLTPKELTTINGTSELGNPKPSEVVGLQVKGMENDATPDDLVALESSYYVLENLEDSSGTLYAAGKDGINPDGGIAGLQLAEISSSSLKLPAQVPVPVNQFDSITYQSETAGLPSSILAFSDSGSKEHVSSPAAPLKLVEEQIPCLQDLGPGVLENDTTCLSGVIREPEVVEEEKSGQMCLVEERETAALDFESVCSTEHDDDHPKPEVSYTDSIIYHDSEVEQKAGTVNGAKSQPPVQQSWLHKEEESVQQRIAVDQVSDVATLHIGCVSEESVSPETFALPQTTVNNELPDSCTRVNSESSSTLPASQLQMRDHDNYERFGDLASSFPPESYPSSESLLPGSTDASAKPNDPLGFIFSPGDLFSKTNQVNLDESHPLPPLPPLQWRIGKLQHASSTTKADKTELEELFPKEIFPYESAIENVKFVPEQVKQSPIQSPHMTFKEENLEHGFPSLETNSLHMTIGFPQKVENEQPQLFTLSKESEVSSPAEAVGVSEESETVKSPTRIVPKLVLKEENTELYLPTVEAESVNEVADPSPEVENEKPQLFTLAKESEVSPPAVEDRVSEGSQTVKSPAQIVPKLVLEEENTELCFPTLEAESVDQVADPPPEVEKEQPQLFTLTKESEVSPPAVEDGVSEGSQTVKSSVQKVPKLVLEEENTELSFPTPEAESVDQVAYPPPEVEKEQQQLLVPAKESEVPSPAVADGVSIGSRTLKLPRTCNPIIGSVAALDKSRLRKVTEQARPQIGNQDERNAMLEQIRAKTFSLKPTSTSRPKVQGPNTNLKVAAILEKANAIRQAFAGSDEDEDSWSDS